MIYLCDSWLFLRLVKLIISSRQSPRYVISKIRGMVYFQRSQFTHLIPGDHSAICDRNTLIYTPRNFYFRSKDIFKGGNPWGVGEIMGGGVGIARSIYILKWQDLELIPTTSRLSRTKGGRESFETEETKANFSGMRRWARVSM